MRRLMVPASLLMVSACAQTPAPASEMTFDECLITHMAASAMLEDATTEEDIALRAAVIASQTELLRDDNVDEDELATRTSALMRSYAPSADAAIAEAKAISTPPVFYAAKAILCGQELTE